MFDATFPRFARLSPDGDQLAWAQPRASGPSFVVVADIADDGIAERAWLAIDTGRIGELRWAYTNRHFVYLSRTSPAEAWQPYLINLVNGERLNLLENIPDVMYGTIERMSPGKPYEILLNVFEEGYWRGYTVNFRDRSAARAEESPGYHAYFDADYEPVLYLGWAETDYDRHYWRWSRAAGWRQVFSIPFNDYATAPMHLSADGDRLSLADARGRDTLALAEVDTHTGRPTILAEHPTLDLTSRYRLPTLREEFGVLFDPVTREPQAAAFTDDQTTWKIIDDAVRSDLAYLEERVEGRFDVVDRSLDDQRWLIEAERDVEPPRYLLYERPDSNDVESIEDSTEDLTRDDRTADRLRFLMAKHADLGAYNLAAMHAVRIPTRDGLELPCYLTLPRWRDHDQNGEPDAGPLPLVMLVHGGPFARDFRQFDARHQWLANRGYAVLSVNYRGSAGFGMKFLRAGHGEWHRKVCHDIADAAKWAAENEIARPGKIVLYGRSYGGFLVLRTAALYPDQFAGVIAENAMLDLMDYAEENSREFAPWTAYTKEFLGVDFTTEAGQAEIRSWNPISNLDRATAPVLMIAGAADALCSVENADQFHEAACEKNVPSIYLRFDQEGHRNIRPENTPLHRGAIESFLAARLGGRAQVLPENTIDASTAEIRSNSDLIPWLPDDDP